LEKKRSKRRKSKVKAREKGFESEIYIQLKRRGMEGALS